MNNTEEKTAGNKPGEDTEDTVNMENTKSSSNSFNSFLLLSLSNIPQLDDGTPGGNFTGGHNNSTGGHSESNLESESSTGLPYNPK